MLSPMMASPKKRKLRAALLGSLLLLLTDTDFEVRLLGFLESLVIVARHRILQVAIHISVRLQDHLQREIVIADRAKSPKALNVRNTHTIMRLAQPWPLTLGPAAVHSPHHCIQKRSRPPEPPPEQPECSRASPPPSLRKRLGGRTVALETPRAGSAPGRGFA